MTGCDDDVRRTAPETSMATSPQVGADELILLFRITLLLIDPTKNLPMIIPWCAWYQKGAEEITA